MRWKRTFSMAWKNMKQRRLRTSLTTLGVVIGIAAIIALTSLGEGFRSVMTTEIEKGFELDIIMVMHGMQGMPGGMTEGTGFLAKEDVEKIGQFDEVTVATPVIQKAATLYSDDENATTSVMAVNFTDFRKIYPDRFVFDEGGLPDPIENDTLVLGYRVAHGENGEVFAYPGDNLMVEVTLVDPTTGMRVSENYTFTVAGILEESGAALMMSFDDAIFIPLSTAIEVYKTWNLDMAFVKVVDPDYSESVAEKIRDEFEVMAIAPSTMINMMGSMFDLLEIFLAGIAGIALLVAGIGIMNIMTVSVMERTREIGILKAVGAKSRTILTMFLAEAASIGLIGGLIGLILGYGLAHVLGYGLSTFELGMEGFGRRPEMPFTISPVLSPLWVVGAIVFAVAISVLFGLYPARKAAKLDPVEALRYE